MSGYTRVDNWLFDEVMPAAKPNTFKVVAAVVRKTAGWRKPADIISLSELKRITGIGGFSTLTAAINDAIECGYITRVERGDSYLYSVSGTPEIGGGYSQNGSSGTPEIGVVGTPEIGDTKEKEKETIKTLTKAFQEATGLFPNPDSFDRLWEPVFEHWLATYGESTPDLIGEAVKFARSNKFTIKSPASIDTIMSNMERPGRVNGVLEVGYR